MHSSSDKLPSVKSAEEEDNQSHNALGVPPLDVWGGGRRDRRRGGAAGLDQTQQAGVAPTVCTQKALGQNATMRRRRRSWSVTLIQVLCKGLDAREERCKLHKEVKTSDWSIVVASSIIYHTTHTFTFIHTSMLDDQQLY